MPESGIFIAYKKKILERFCKKKCCLFLASDIRVLYLCCCVCTMSSLLQNGCVIAEHI